MVQNGRVRVAVDAMGGDYAPEEVVKGAVRSAQKGDVEIFRQRFIHPCCRSQRSYQRK